MRLSALGLVALVATASRLVAGDDLASVAPGLGVAPDRGLGPGMAPWRAAPPEAHGLDAAELSRAANLLEGVPHRDCLVVIKDGELVHETYYGDARRDARLATDNVGLLAVVALVGAAENQGLVHLDVPIADHGVDISDVFGPEHGPVVTLRHLLAQTHGGGEVPPGSVFRRDDSPAFLDVIVRLLETVSGRPFPAFARLALGEKIGAPNLFDGRTVPGDAIGDGDDAVSVFVPGDAAGRSNAAGYLRATCGEMAKVAQLFLNDGAFPDRDGVPRQILSARFVRETFTPAFPELNQAHGLAAWLHGPVDARGAACCRPVTGMTACGESAAPLDGPILGPVEDEDEETETENAAKSSATRFSSLARAPGPRERVAIALGNDGSAIFIAPRSNVAAVTLGRTIAGSAACPLSAEDVAASALGVGSARRDDAALLRVFWDALEPAMRLDGEAPTIGGGYAAAATAAARGAHEKGSGAHDKGSGVHAKGARRARGMGNGGGSDAVRDMVTDAFERSFEARIGKRGGVDDASGDASSRLDPGVSDAPFGGSFRGPPRAADAEVRRLAERQSKWYAEREMRMSEERRQREKQFDESMEALKRTQAKYQRAYEMAKREIAAAAAEEKRAEAQERGAQTLATAARWQSQQLAASQKTQQAALDERRRALDAKYDEVADAQKEYKAALAAAKRAREAAEAYRDELRGVSDRKTEDRVSGRDDVDETEARGERRAEARRYDAARGEETSLESAARAEDALETREEWTSRRAAKKKKKAKEEEEANADEETTGEEDGWSGTDWSGETDVFAAAAKEISSSPDTSSSSASASVGEIDIGDLDFASKKETPRRKKSSERRSSERKSRASSSSSSPSSSSSSSSNGDVRASLPTPGYAVEEADDLLAELTPKARARARARLGALEALDARLDEVEYGDGDGDDTRASDGDESSGSDAADSDGTEWHPGAADVIFAQWPVIPPEANDALRAAADAPDDPSSDPSSDSSSDPSSDPSSDSSSAPLLPALGGVLSWFVGGDARARDVSTATPTVSDVSASDVSVRGACVCSCPGVRRESADARERCVDVDLGAAPYYADGPSACEAIAAAGSDACPSVGVVQRCEAPEASGPASRSSESSSSSSSSSARGGGSKPPRRHGNGVDRDRDDRDRDARLGVRERDETRPLSSAPLGDRVASGAMECVKTSACASSLGSSASSASSAAPWFLAEAYECRATSYAACRWAPDAACPGSATISTASLEPSVANAGAVGGILTRASGSGSGSGSGYLAASDRGYGLAPRPEARGSSDVNGNVATVRVAAVGNGTVAAAAFVAFAAAALVAVARARGFAGSSRRGGASSDSSRARRVDSNSDSDADSDSERRRLIGRPEGDDDAIAAFARRFGSDEMASEDVERGVDANRRGGRGNEKEKERERAKEKAARAARARRARAAVEAGGVAARAPRREDRRGWEERVGALPARPRASADTGVPNGVA